MKLRNGKDSTSSSEQDSDSPGDTPPWLLFVRPYLSYSMLMLTFILCISPIYAKRRRFLLGSNLEHLTESFLPPNDIIRDDEAKAIKNNKDHPERRKSSLESFYLSSFSLSNPLFWSVALMIGVELIVAALTFDEGVRLNGLLDEFYANNLNKDDNTFSISSAFSLLLSQTISKTSTNLIPMITTSTAAAVTGVIMLFYVDLGIGWALYTTAEFLCAELIAILSFEEGVEGLSQWFGLFLVGSSVIVLAVEGIQD